MRSDCGYTRRGRLCVGAILVLPFLAAGCAGAGAESPNAAAPATTPNASRHTSRGVLDASQRDQKSSDEAVTNAHVEARLRQAMLELPPRSAVQRIALADIAYPANADENQKLGGFTLLIVTAVTHEAAELPPRVRFRHSGGELMLPVLMSRLGTLDAPDFRGVFGAHRFDGLYAIPIQATQTDGAVLVNFEAVAREFRPLEFPSDLPAGIEPISPTEPDMATLRSFAEREFPIVEERALVPAGSW